MDQLCFFSTAQTEKEIIFNELVYELAHRFIHKTHSQIIQGLKKYANSGGAFKYGWLIDYNADSVDITICNHGYVRYTFTYKSIADAIIQRR